MKKRVIQIIAVMFLFCLFIIPNKVYAEELEIKMEEVTIETTAFNFATEEDLMAYIYETYGIDIRPTNLDMVTGSITSNKTATGIGFTINVQSVGGYADKVGIRGVTIRVYATGSSAYSSTSADGFYGTNTFSCAGGYEITNPKSGYSYQVAGTFYTVIKGIEYTYYVESSKLTF